MGKIMSVIKFNNGIGLRIQRSIFRDGFFVYVWFSNCCCDYLLATGLLLLDLFLLLVLVLTYSYLYLTDTSIPVFKQIYVYDKILIFDYKMSINVFQFYKDDYTYYLLLSYFFLIPYTQFYVVVFWNYNYLIFYLYDSIADAKF